MVGPFPQSTFRPCYLGYGCNRLCLENSLEGEVCPHLHPCTIVGVLSHFFVFYFIIWLLKRSIDHSAHLPLSYQNFKKGEGLDRILVFRRGLVGKEGGNFFEGGCNFYITNKLTSAIFNDKKKFINKNVFLCHN